MPVLKINFATVGERVPQDWVDAKQHGYIDLTGPTAPTIGVLVMPEGMRSGKPSVMFKLELPDGQIVITETSAALFATFGRMILARYPDLFDGL